jgi:hypothetical protein
MRHGADALHADDNGQTPLHIAARGGFPRTCSALLEAAAMRARGLSMRNANGLTPLHLAAQHGSTEVCRRLLEQSCAEVASLTLQRRTPLHLSAMSGHAAAVECLLAAKPEVQEWEDIEGMRALDYAQERGFDDIACMLSSAALHQDTMLFDWSSKFEPPCRALLNARACDAFLELGKPRLLSAEHSVIRITTRAVDVLGLIRGYAVELCTAGVGEPTAPWEASPVKMKFARSGDQGAIDDVEFRVSRRSSKGSAWRPGALCRFRVVGTLAPKAGADAGVVCRSVSSAWSSVARIPG